MAALKLVDYVPQLDRMLQHWTEVEAERGAALTMPDGTTHSLLLDLRPTLVEAQNVLVTASNSRQRAGADRDASRKALFTVGRRFNAAVRGILPSTTFVKELPRLPSVSSDPEKQLTAFRDMLDIWRHIDAPASPTAPVVPGAGFKVRIEEDGTEKDITHADFEGRLAALTEASRRFETTTQAQENALQTRNKLHEKLKALTMAYRKWIRGLYPPGSVLRRTLP